MVAGVLFRDELLRNSAEYSGQLTQFKKEPFKYINYGALAYVGNSRGVAELKAIWDLPPFNHLPFAAAGTTEASHNSKSLIAGV
jgi:NADH dehydrogenase FAD-containing subunit